MTMERIKMKTKRARVGRNRRKTAGGKAAPQPTSRPETPQPLPATQPDLSPLDFALRIMRDETQPPALRASMAKAAMPYLHQRADGDAAPDDKPAEAPKAPPMSDLELARRIAHILGRAQTQSGNPVEKPAKAGDGVSVGAKTF
jgi:hypothetical protein